MGEQPSPEEFVEALKNKQVILYCGHGTGEQYLKSAIQFEGSKQSQEEMILNINSTILLFGCSSGLLKQIGEYTHDGAVITYLKHGSPNILCNLWDVTDKDMDRFTLKFIEDFRETGNITDSVRKSRSACTLKNLIGNAPVVYGIPKLL